MSVRDPSMWQRWANLKGERSTEAVETAKADGSEYGDYMARRYAQLIEEDFRWWVFRFERDGCEGKFAELDGVAVEPSHAFWTKYSPPHGPGCACYVVGARSSAGISRVGGTRDKPLPNWVLEGL